MANKKGQLNCAADLKNTGFGDCVEDWKLIAGALIYERPRSFTAAELADLQDTLTADANNDSKSARMYPIHKFVNGTDNTEDPVIQTFDYGPKVVVRDGDNDWLFQFVDGGNCLAQGARSHNGPKHVLFYDKDNKILGYNKNNQLTTIPTQFVYTMPWKMATGSTVAAYAIRFVFESRYANKDRAFVKASFDLPEITGLQDIEVVVNSFNEDTGVANVTLQTACGGTNLYDEYGAQVVVGLFTAVDEEGNEVTPTAVALVPASKTFNLTLDTADFPDSGIIYLSGVAPSAMATANIEGFEISTVELEVAGS